MNDIASLSVQDQASFTNLFADDTSLYVANGDPTMLATELQQAVDNLSQWFDNWLLNVNIEKTALLILRKKGMPAIPITVRICGDVIHQVNKHKHLGLILNSTLTWKDHVDYVCSKAAQRIGLLHRIRKRLSALAIRSVYLTSVRPVLEYAQLAWCGLSAQDINHLERLQRRAARVITGVKPWSRPGTCHEVLLAHAGLPTLSEHRLIAQAVFVFKVVNDLDIPCHLSNLIQAWLPEKPIRCLALRDSQTIRLPRFKSSISCRSPLHTCFSFWNSLSKDMRQAPSVSSLQKLISSHFLK